MNKQPDPSMDPDATHWQTLQRHPWAVPTKLSFLRVSCIICSSRMVRSSSDTTYQQKKIVFTFMPSVHLLIVPCEKPSNRAIRRWLRPFTFQFLDLWSSLSPLLEVLRGMSVHPCAVSHELSTLKAVLKNCSALVTSWQRRTSLRVPADLNLHLRILLFFSVICFFCWNSNGSKVLPEPVLTAALFWWLHAGCQ